jgi:transcriptional regulator with XRE-family HTH domain
VSFQQIQKYERGAHRLRVSQLRRLAEALAVSPAELLEIPGTESSKIADMIDTRLARRLMNAFQSLTSRERGLSRSAGRDDGGAAVGRRVTPFWQRRANVWRRQPNPLARAERLISRAS